MIIEMTIECAVNKSSLEISFPLITSLIVYVKRKNGFHPKEKAFGSFQSNFFVVHFASFRTISLIRKPLFYIQTFQRRKKVFSLSKWFSWRIIETRRTRKWQFLKASTDKSVDKNVQATKRREIFKATKSFFRFDNKILKTMQQVDHRRMCVCVWED